MGRAPVQRYKDVDLYAQEIEEVYDLSIEFEFGTDVRLSDGLVSLHLKGFDKDDEQRQTGPLYYVHAWIKPAPAFAKQQGIIRALTELTRQCFVDYCERGQTRS